MPEKIEELVRAAISAAQEAGELPEFEVGDLGFERPADPSNGQAVDAFTAYDKYI